MQEPLPKTGARWEVICAYLHCYISKRAPSFAWLAIALAPGLGPTRARKLGGCGILRLAHHSSDALLSRIVVCLLP